MESNTSNGASHSKVWMYRKIHEKLKAEERCSESRGAEKVKTRMYQWPGHVNHVMGFFWNLSRYWYLINLNLTNILYCRNMKHSFLFWFFFVYFIPWIDNSDYQFWSHLNFYIVIMWYWKNVLPNKVGFSFIIFLNDHGDETHIIGWYFRFHHFLSVWIFFVVINIVLISPLSLSLSLTLYFLSWFCDHSMQSDLPYCFSLKTIWCDAWWCQHSLFTGI